MRAFEELTPKLIDLLAIEHIKATFFVIGEKVAQQPAILSRAARERHEIGIVCEIHTAALSRTKNFAVSWCADTGRQGGPICLQG